MRFAFTTLACPDWTTEQVAETAQRLGYNGVELRLLDGAVLDPVAGLDKVVLAVEVIRRHGVDVCALDTSCTFNHADPAERARQVAELRQWISLAQEVRVPILRVFGGSGNSNDKASQQESTGWVTSALREVAAQAERTGVTVALETHDAFSSARRVGRILDDIASPNIGALWDSHHPYRMGEDADVVVGALGARIVHVHVKDARRVAPHSNEWQLLPLGEGEVPVKAQLAALSRFGYKGYVSVEWEKKWHPEIAEPEVALPQHIAWLKQATGTAT
ncbi:MAG: Xylose isomerase protein barrel [Chloroflexi bacterium]|nr:Xylose isomerase protein barrel [Chloroflexota bacterium]